ncbi:Membrane protein [Acidisarcina polymorpha]|uniref:Membrane protein n=1 Tax=Acidisarcina polymorpha TaxID=2211140 RepID=A0A2Z5G561_9BACT|nr:flippase [Acidisarcina polymorpha]AXC13676.1 Membrane protein [Acidisarcina polymorpha]
MSFRFDRGRLAPMLSRLQTSTLAKNSLWVFSGQGASIIIQAFYFMVIARLLTPSQWGLYAGAAALVTMIASYSSLGSGLVFLRHVSLDSSRHSIYFGNILLTTFTMGSMLAIAVHFCAPWLVGSASVRLVTVLAVGDFFFLNIAGCMSQIFQTYEQMRISAMIGLVVNLSRFALACLLLVLCHQISAQTWAYASVGVSSIGALASLVIVFRRFGPPRFDLLHTVKHAGEGLSFAMSGTAVGAYNDIDKVMLVHYGMTAANGIYAMAYRIVDVCTVPIRSIHSAAFPRFFRLGATGVEPAFRFASKLLRRTYIIAIVGTVCMFLAAPLLPHVVGPNYRGSVSVLRWLCLLPLFRCLHLSAGDALAGIGHQRMRLMAQFSVAFFNFGLNLFLIPRFSWRGAAWSSLATDGALAVICWAMLLFLLEREGRSSAVMGVEGLTDSVH